MELSDEGLAFLAEWEGRRNRPYDDALGHCTVGIGHLIHQGGCTAAELADSYTDDEVDELFRSDAERFVRAVDETVEVPLSQRQFDALVSFAFNWGIGAGTGFPSTSVVQLVNAGDFAAAAADMVDGHGPSGRPYDKGLEGVRRRRIAEAEWLRSEARSMKFVSRSEWGARPPRSVTLTDEVVGVACHWEGPFMGWPWPHDGNAGLLAESAEVRERRIDRVAAALKVLHADRMAKTAGAEAAPDPFAVAAALTEVWSASCADKVAGIQRFHMDGQGWNDLAYNALYCGHGYVFEGRGPGVSNAANGDSVANRRYLAACYLGGDGDPFTDEAKDACNDAAEWLGVADLEWTGHRDHTATACPGGEIYDWAHSGHPRGTTGSPVPPTPPPPAPKVRLTEEEDNVRLVAVEDVPTQVEMDTVTVFEGETTPDDRVYRLTWARANGQPNGAGVMRAELFIRKLHPAEGELHVVVFWPISQAEVHSVHAGQTLALPIKEDGAVAVLSPLATELVVEYDERLVLA